MSKDLEYWLSRAIDRDNLDKDREQRLLKELFALYEDAYKDTQEKLFAFYVKYGDEKGLSYKDAKKSLKAIELKECSNRIKRLSDLKNNIDTSTPYGKERAKQIQKEIQLLRSRGIVTREMALMDSINEKWIQVAYKIDVKLGDLIKETYKREYQDSLREAGVSPIRISDKTMESAILVPTFGEHFSERVWKNKDKIVTFARTEIRKGLVEGTNVRKTAKKLEKQMGVSNYEAMRLVVTENAIARTNGSLEGYRESRVVEKVIVIPVGDKRTCPECMDLDGVVIPLEQAIVGVNVPPIHPKCRCAVAPYIE